MSIVNRLLQNNAGYAARFDAGGLQVVPVENLALVTCMDARIDVYSMLGLELGDAHVIRNAGGVITDDVIRSLVVSQTMLRTDKVLVVQHTGCGMLDATDQELAERVEAAAGSRPAFEFLTFDDLHASLRRSVRKLRECAYLPHRDRIHGLIYDVNTGVLREVA
jgi:carbonic anhydrase